MPRRFTGKLFHFLFTHLELGTFGERLRWLDRGSGTFQLLWKHGNGSSRTPEEDVALFMAWHQEKKRRKPCDSTEAKQRFRAAANKMRLEVVESWQGVLPEKNFRFRRFPKDDLEYLLRHADLDQDVPWYSTDGPSSGEMILSTMEPEEGLFLSASASAETSDEDGATSDQQGPPLRVPKLYLSEEHEVKISSEDQASTAPSAPEILCHIKVENTCDDEVQDSTVFTPTLASPREMQESRASGLQANKDAVLHRLQSTSRHKSRLDPTAADSASSAVGKPLWQEKLEESDAPALVAETGPSHNAVSTVKVLLNDWTAVDAALEPMPAEEFLR